MVLLSMRLIRNKRWRAFLNGKKRANISAYFSLFHKEMTPTAQLPLQKAKYFSKYFLFSASN